MTIAFDLQEYGITVAEIHCNLPPSSLYEHAIRYEKDASIAENGRWWPPPASRPVARPKTNGSCVTRNQRPTSGGARERPSRSKFLRSQSRARPRLFEHARPAVLLRWFCRLGPEVSHQGARDLLAPIPRALRAHDADPPQQAGIGGVRQARFCHLQCRGVPRQSPDGRRGIENQHLPRP